MSRRLLILPEAESELAESYRWYEDRWPGLGGEFMRCVDVCLASVRRNPGFYPLVHENIRKALVRRFPFGVFYKVRGETIVVQAIFHASRDPNRWRERQ